MRALLLLTPLLLGLISCTVREEAAPSTSGPVADAAIVAFLSRTVGERAPAYPDARLVGVQMNAARTMACGYIVSPGKPPHIMISRDSAPADADRPVSMAMLAKDGMWEMPSNADASASRLNACRGQGLLQAGSEPDPDPGS